MLEYERDVKSQRVFELFFGDFGLLKVMKAKQAADRREVVVLDDFGVKEGKIFGRKRVEKMMKVKIRRVLGCMIGNKYRSLLFEWTCYNSFLMALWLFCDNYYLFFDLFFNYEF